MKTKKLLSLLLSVAMIFIMLSAFNVSVSAIGENVVYIDDPETLTSTYFEQFSEDTTVILKKDMVLTQGLRFCAKTGVNLTVKSADPKSPVTLTNTVWACASGFDNSGWSGNILLKDFNIVSNIWSFEIYTGVNLTMENMTIRSDLNSVSAYQGYCTMGFYNVQTTQDNLTANVTMKNCTIDGGNNGAKTDGIYIYNKAKLNIIDSTILGGTGSGTTDGYIGSGHGIYLGENFADNQITVTNSTVKGGKALKGAAGMGICNLSGTLTLNNSSVYGGAAEGDATMGVPLSLYKSAVTVNGGELVPGNDVSSLQFSGTHYIQPYSTSDDTTTVVINPTFSIVGSNVKMFPTIGNVTVSVNETESATTDRDGILGGVELGDVIIPPDSITLPNSYTATVNNKIPFTVSKKGTPVTVTTEIPSPVYTIMIPENIDFGDRNQALERYKDAQVDQYGYDINVNVPFKIYGKNIDNLFDDLGKKPQLDITVSFNGILNADNSSTVPYVVKDANGNDFKSNNVFCSFKNSSEVAGQQSSSGSIWINRTNIKESGNYSGIMTFTISVPDAE